MAKYVKRRNSFDDDDYDAWAEDVPMLPSLTVEMENGRATGLVDKDGNELMKLPDSIGYVRF